MKKVLPLQCIFHLNLNTMTRQSRKKSMSGIYHVMLRGINKSDIFHDRMDFVKFRILLEQVVHPVDELGHPMPPRCRIFAYCMMSNHVHLLVKEESDNLSTLIKRIGGSYAQYYNVKYQRVGHLFQDRFRSEPVETDAYFITLLRYIHQNPVAAGLTNDVLSYEWSSWREFLTKGTVPIVRKEEVFDRISFEDLVDLVNEPLPKTTVILDYNTKAQARSDEEVSVFLCDTFSLKRPEDLALYSPDRLSDIVRQAKDFGASIRQLVRLTGISFHRIRIT